MNLKTNFTEMLGIGISIDNIEEQLLKDVSIKNDAYEYIFWAVLKSLEWEYGVLNNYIKNKTKYIIKTVQMISCF